MISGSLERDQLHEWVKDVFKIVFTSDMVKHELRVTISKF